MAEEGAGSPTSMYNKHARRLAHGLDTRLSIARQVCLLWRVPSWLCVNSVVGDGERNLVHDGEALAP